MGGGEYVKGVLRTIVVIVPLVEELIYEGVKWVVDLQGRSRKLAAANMDFREIACSSVGMLGR